MTDNEPIAVETNTEDLEPLTKPGLLGHVWRQSGPYLECQSCAIRHGVYIGTGQILVGLEEDGTPRLRRID
jgi:hypothetical protein